MHPSVRGTTGFTMAETWKQPKRPLTDEWTEKMWCTDTGLAEKLIWIFPQDLTEKPKLFDPVQ